MARLFFFNVLLSNRSINAAQHLKIQSRRKKNEEEVYTFACNETAMLYRYNGDEEMILYIPVKK